MTCHDYAARLHAYVDGELGVDETAIADAHLMRCSDCRALAERERQFRELVRRQPREAAPAELRARIVGDIRRVRRRAALRPWLVAPALGAVAAALLLILWPTSTPTPLVGELVDKHIAYAQIEHPAELTSTSAAEIREWFRGRAGLRVTVPDYGAAGIQLIGARLAEAHERKAAYLLYRKGMMLLSVFMVPIDPRDARLRGTPVAYRDQSYMTWEWKGHRTVAWTDGRTLFGLVSMLDYEALLECADRLRLERGAEARR
jgi:mycothiol system anti-sigma-R factor